MNRSFRRGSNMQGVRIDARTPSPEKARGDRRIHRDTDGTVIGAVGRDGTGYGTRSASGFPVDGSRLGNPTTPGLDRNAAMNGAQTAPNTFRRTVAAPAGSQLLKDRQALHREMVAAGGGAITPAMEARAAQLGVQPGSFRRVAGGLAKKTPALPTAPSLVPGIGTALAMTGGKPAASPAAGTPAAAKPTFRRADAPAGTVQVGAKPFVPGVAEPGLTPQLAANTPGAVPAAAADGQRVNRLTGKPFGYVPPQPAASDAAAEVAARQKRTSFRRA